MLATIYYFPQDEQPGPVFFDLGFRSPENIFFKQAAQQLLPIEQVSQITEILEFTVPLHFMQDLLVCKIANLLQVSQNIVLLLHYISWRL